MAKVDLAPSAAAERPALTTIVMTGGESYASNEGSDASWRVVAAPPLSDLLGEMDCRSILADLKTASLTVKVRGDGDVRGRAAQTYEVQYDTTAWSAAIGDSKKAKAASATMVLSVIDGRLAQLELFEPYVRTTEYLWFPGPPDVAAPPADLLTK